MCIRQASMFNDLRSRLISHGFTNIEYKIVSMTAGGYNLKNLEDASPDIPVYQETPSDKTCDTLGAGKDHFLIIDSCNRLVYQVIMPWSFLFYPYVKAAILSAYNDQPCGDCDGNPVTDEQVTVTIIKHVHLPEIFQATFKPPKEYKYHGHKKAHHHKHVHPHYHHHHHHRHPVYHNFMHQDGNRMTVTEQYDTLKNFLMQHLVLVGVGNEAIPVHTQGTQEDYKKYYTVVNTDASTVNTESEHNIQSQVFKDVVVHTDELTKVPEGTDAIRVEQLEGNTAGHETGTVDEFLSPAAPTHQIILWYPHHHIFKGERQKDHYYIVLNSKNPNYHGHVVPGKEEGKVVIGHTFEGEKIHQIGEHITTGDTIHTADSTTSFNAGGVTAAEHTEHSYTYNTTRTETHHSIFGSEHTTNELVTGEKKTHYHDKAVTGTTVVEGSHGAAAGEHASTTLDETNYGPSFTVAEHDTTTEAGAIGHDIHHTGLINTEQTAAVAEHGHQTATGLTDQERVTHIATDGVNRTAGQTSGSSSSSDSSAHGDVTHSTSQSLEFSTSQSSCQTIGGVTYSSYSSSSSGSSTGGHHTDNMHKIETTGADTAHGQTTTGQEGYASTTHGDTSHSTSSLNHSADSQTHTGSSTGTHESSGAYGQTTGTHTISGHDTTIQGSEHRDSSTGSHGEDIHDTSGQVIGGGYGQSTNTQTAHGSHTQTMDSHGSTGYGHSSFGQSGTIGHATSSQSSYGGTGTSGSHTSGSTTGSHSSYEQSAATGSHTSGSQSTFGQSSITGSHITGSQSSHGESGSHISGSESTFGQSNTTSNNHSSYGQSGISGSHSSYGQSAATGSHTSGSQSTFGQSSITGSQSSYGQSGSHSTYGETKESQTGGIHTNYAKTTGGHSIHKESSGGHGIFSGGHSSTGYGSSSHHRAPTEHTGKIHGGYDDRIIFRDESREDLNFSKYLQQFTNLKPNDPGFHSRSLDEEEEPEKSKEGKDLINHYSKILPWIEYPVD